MRILLILVLFLQGSFSNGQTVNKQAITLDEALKTALHNNPTAFSTDEKKKLSCDIKSTWYLWLFSINKWQTLKEYEVLLGDLNRIARLRNQSGDIESLVESSLMDTFADVETSVAIAANDLAIIENQFRQFLVADHEFVPADTSLSLYQVDKGTIVGNPSENQSTAISRTDSSFLQYQLFLKKKTTENKELELDGLFMRLQYYFSSGLPYAETILRVSQVKFKNEDIDYLEFTESIAQAFRIKLGYLETLNKYNQSAIQLEYYAY